jgi:hypothetical protein
VLQSKQPTTTSNQRKTVIDIARSDRTCAERSSSSSSMMMTSTALAQAGLAPSLRQSSIYFCLFVVCLHR